MQIGPYTIERELGRGGMGAVYLGKRSGDPLPYAIKVVHANLADDPDLLTRFEREGQVLERLDHPNLVGFHARGNFQGGLWLAMDYVKGESLEERLSRTGPWPSHAAGQLLVSLCAGLAHAHRAGVLHRDLKPANVLLRASDGQALVADFGLALPLDVSQHLTQSGEVLGSPGYLAPEQCGVGGGSTPATDVYGLGAILYSVLTGQRPHQGATLLATLDLVITAAPRPPRELVPDVDPALEAICLRCLAKDPSERFADALELQAALAQEPPPLRRRSRGVGLALAATLVLGSLLATLAWFQGGQVQGGEGGPSPTPADQPSAQPETSATPTPTPAGQGLQAKLNGVIAAQDWQRGHTLLEGSTGSGASWGRYRLLAAELDATGEETKEWGLARRQAVDQARAGSAESAWNRALIGALRSLADSYLGERLTPDDLNELKRALAGAGEAVLEPAQRRALARAEAEVYLRLSRLYLAESDLVRAEPYIARAEAKQEAWRLQDEANWRVDLLLARLKAMRRDATTALKALRRVEIAGLAAGSSWARFAVYDELSRLSQAPGRVRRDQLWLPRAILAAPSAPASLRLRAALRVASYDLHHDEALAACRLLLATPPPPGTSRGLQLEWSHLLTEALLAAKNPEAARTVIQEAKAQGLESPSLRLLAVITSCHLSSTDRAREAFAQIPPPRSSREVLLEFRAAALLGDSKRWQDSARRLGERKNPNYAWEELKAVEADAAQGFKGSAGILESLAASHQKNSINLVGRLIVQGRWEEALKVLERFGGPEGSKDELLIAARQAYRALRRGRDDQDPSSALWRAGRAQGLRIVARLPKQTPARTGLEALIESLGRVKPDRFEVLHRQVRLALETYPTWEELNRGHLRLIADWRGTPGAPPDLEGPAARTTQRWIQALRGTKRLEVELKLAEAHLSGEPRRAELLGKLAAQLQRRPPSPQTQRVFAAALRAQHRVGALTGARVSTTLRELASSPFTLRAVRRALLLEAAELLIPPGAHAQEILAILRRLKDWCGPPTLPAELARLRRLESEVHASLGDGAAALAAAQPLEGLLEDLVAPERAKAMAQLGRARVLSGTPSAGLNRIQAAVRLDPSFEVLLCLARSLRGTAQEMTYAAALSFESPREWAPLLVEEIVKAGFSPSKLFRIALPALEARNESNTGGVSFARVLFEADPSPDHALLLWEAYAIGLRGLPLRYRSVTGKLRATLERARKKLHSPVRTLSRRIDELLEARARVMLGNPSASARAVLVAASHLENAAVDIPALGDRLRVPFLLDATYEDLRANLPKEKVQLRVRGLAHLQAFQKRGGAPRLPIRIAFRHTQVGDFARAVETLQQGLGKTAASQTLLRARFHLDLAVNLSLLGNELEAQKSVEQAQVLAVDLVERARAWLLSAQIKLRAQDYPTALSAIRIANSLCPQQQDTRDLWIRIQVTWGRLRLRLGQLKAVRTMLPPLGSYLELKGADPLAAAEVHTLRAEVDLAERNWEGADSSASKALSLWPISADAHLARLEAMVGAKRFTEARALGEASLKDSQIPPRGHKRIQARLSLLGKLAPPR